MSQTHARTTIVDLFGACGAAAGAPAKGKREPTTKQGNDARAGVGTQTDESAPLNTEMEDQVAELKETVASMQRTIAKVQGIVKKLQHQRLNKPNNKRSITKSRFAKVKAKSAARSQRRNKATRRH